MNLIIAAQNILSGLKNYLGQIDEVKYRQPIELFSGATLGQHTRHILEFFQCLLQQKDEGTINYDKRSHDQGVEQNPSVAINIIEEILAQLSAEQLKKKLILEVNYDHVKDEFETLETSYERELSYNIEHAIHHIAIIKIGLKSIAPEVVIPVDFGVAPSTIRYQNSVCAH